LDIYPTDWLRFNYFHGWLNSNVFDSTESYPTYREGVNRDQYRNKFIASHSLTLTPFSGFDVTLGESVIYSDKIEIAYLMPLMFFRLADHYLSQNNNNTGANSQFFINLSSKNNIPNTHIYCTLLIDEIRISELFNVEEQKNQIGFTIGASTVDLPINNLTLNIEYTKIYPFVYKHYIPTQTYENSSFVLGHWIGHNADIVFGSLNYRFIRGLQATLWYEYVRKGSEGKVDDQYTQPQPPFLFGLRKNFTNFGAEIKYEIMHELFVRVHYQYNEKSEKESENLFLDSRLSYFAFAIFYGL
jgi:hypothetical protein